MANGFTLIHIDELDAIENINEDSLFLVQNGTSESNSVTWQNLANSLSAGILSSIEGKNGIIVEYDTEDGKTEIALDSLFYSPEKSYKTGQLFIYQDEEDGNRIYLLYIAKKDIDVGATLTTDNSQVLINSSDTKYTLPIATDNILGGIRTPQNHFKTDENGNLNLIYNSKQFYINESGSEEENGLSLTERIKVKGPFTLAKDKWEEREQTVQMGVGYKITDRNVIDIAPNSMEDWSLCGVYGKEEFPTITEESEDGQQTYTPGYIKFKYIYAPPENDLQFFITSMTIDNQSQPDFS